MNDARRAVFLSYASQDAEAARKICDALRATGIEVWFDLNELVGGDVWDAKIRKQIADCALFVPVISANTEARLEGYFRIEWKLAAQRTHAMAEEKAFLLPVVVDATRDADAKVPVEFRAVQWTKLPGGVASPAFCARVTSLLTRSNEAPAGGLPVDRGESAATAKSTPLRKVWWLIPAAGIALAAAFLVYRSEKPAETTMPPAATIPAPPASAKSEARKMADRAFAMSVDRYDSTADDYATADDFMKRAVALDPQDGEIWARSAQLNLMYRNRGFDFSPARIAQGRKEAERAMALAPNSDEAVFARGLAQRYTQNPAAALETWQRVLTLNPNHARALLMLASASYTAGKDAEGAAYYARARQHREWLPLADYSEFLRKFSHRQFTEADRLARSSFQAQPSANNAGAIAIIHLTWKGDLEIAARELAALPPALIGTTRVAVSAARVHMGLRAPDEALRVLDRITDDWVQDSYFTGPKTLLVARANFLAGRETAARIALTTALQSTDAKMKETPNDPLFHRIRGEIFAWEERTEEAMAEAKAVNEINKGVSPIWDSSEAQIYAVLGRADLLVPILQQQLKATSNWPLTPALLRLDPIWDRVRGDAAFQALLAEYESAEPAAIPAHAR